MKIRTTTTTYHSGNEEDVFNFSTKTRVIPKWKIYLTLFAIFAVALLFVVLLIWGFVQLLPIIIFIILLVLIYKLIKQLRGK